MFYCNLSSICYFRVSYVQLVFLPLVRNLFDFSWSHLRCWLMSLYPWSIWALYNGYMQPLFSFGFWHMLVGLGLIPKYLTELIDYSSYVFLTLEFVFVLIMLLTTKCFRSRFHSLCEMQNMKQLVKKKKCTVMLNTVSKIYTAFL
jgi:hypothetical protein